MNTFFIYCGNLLRHEILSSGAFPKTTYTVLFTYENGIATFNGSSWEFQLYA